MKHWMRQMKLICWLLVISIICWCSESSTSLQTDHRYRTALVLGIFLREGGGVSTSTQAHHEAKKLSFKVVSLFSLSENLTPNPNHGPQVVDGDCWYKALWSNQWGNRISVPPQILVLILEFILYPVFLPISPFFSVLITIAESSFWSKDSGKRVCAPPSYPSPLLSPTARTAFVFAWLTLAGPPGLLNNPPLFPANSLFEAHLLLANIYS